LLHPASVLDVGCGDGEATRGLPIRRYVGLDLSSEAISRAQAGRQEGEFRVGSITDHDIHAELVICLDVLIHQPHRDGYVALVQRLVDSTSHVLLLSGFEHQPAMTSPMVHFHEQLTATVRRVAPQPRIYHLRARHGISTMLVVKAPIHPSQRIGIRRMQLEFSFHRLRRAARQSLDRLASSPLHRNRKTRSKD
jgi:SAM-dependent methyltransferase